MQPCDLCQSLCKGWADAPSPVAGAFLATFRQEPGENNTKKPVGGLEGALAGSTAENLGYHAVQQKTLPRCRKHCLEG